MSHKSDLDQEREEIETEQRMTKWPDTLRAPGRSLDQFLWNGDPKATPIQRAGLAVFAAMFLSLFVGCIATAILKRDWTVTLLCFFLGALTGIVGFRLLRNAFRHNHHK